MNPQNKKLISVILLLSLIISASTPLLFINAASSGTTGGTAGISNATPTISSVTFEEVDTTSADGTQIDVNTEYHIHFTVGDDNTIDDLNTVTIKVWEAGTVTEGDADDVKNHYTFVWTESTDAWTEPSLSAIVAGSSTTPSPHTAGSGTFTLAFKLDKQALHTDTGTWDIKIIALDDSSASVNDITLDFGVNFYAEITVNDGTHSWSSLTPGSSDNPLSAPVDTDIDLTFTCNFNFDVQIKSATALTSGAETIALTNLKAHADTLASSVAVTGSYADVVGLTAQAAPGAALAKSFKLWLTVPNPQQDGSYTYTLDIQAIHA